jgi:hypothetical protein
MDSCRGLRTQRSGKQNRGDRNDVHEKDLVGLRRKNLGVPDKQVNVAGPEFV